MGRHKIPVPETLVPLLGILSDREVADRAGVCEITARKWRVAAQGSMTRGRPRGRPRGSYLSLEKFKLRVEKQYPGMIALFGVESDPDLARKYGISRARAHQIRQKLGAPSYRETHAVKWDEIDPLLGTMSDHQVHLHSGVSPQRIKARRESLGIPRHVPPTILERDAKMEVHKHLVGTMSDTDFADLAGVGREQARQFRKNLGVKSFGTSPACADFKRIDRDLVCALFWADKTDEEIAEAAGCFASSIPGVRRALGLLRGSLGKARARSGRLRFVRHRGPNLTQKLDRDLIRKLFQEGKTDEEIAAAVGSKSTTTIASIRRKELGLRRPPGRVQVKGDPA